MCMLQQFVEKKNISSKTWSCCCCSALLIYSRKPCTDNVLFFIYSWKLLICCCCCSRRSGTGGTRCTNPTRCIRLRFNNKTNSSPHNSSIFFLSTALLSLICFPSELHHEGGWTDCRLAMLTPPLSKTGRPKRFSYKNSSIATELKHVTIELKQIKRLKTELKFHRHVVFFL